MIPLPPSVRQEPLQPLSDAASDSNPPWCTTHQTFHPRGSILLEPALWISARGIRVDKGCIDQENIDDSLAALPLFLAGCTRLVIVLGPTYADRLWVPRWDSNC